MYMFFLAWVVFLLSEQTKNIKQISGQFCGLSVDCATTISVPRCKFSLLLLINISLLSYVCAMSQQCCTLAPVMCIYSQSPSAVTYTYWTGYCTFPVLHLHHLFASNHPLQTTTNDLWGFANNMGVPWRTFSITNLVGGGAGDFLPTPLSKKLGRVSF